MEAGLTRTALLAPIAVILLSCSETSAPVSRQASSSGGGSNAGAAGAASQAESSSKGGGLPGCPASPCDAYQNETDCLGRDDPERSYRCAWQQVVIVPEGDLACEEAFSEERCLEMPAGGPGGCGSLDVQCADGAEFFSPNFVRTNRGVAFTLGCGIYPTCFEPCADFGGALVGTEECACAGCMLDAL